jgi:hypothetical protein
MQDPEISKVLPDSMPVQRPVKTELVITSNLPTETLSTPPNEKTAARVTKKPTAGPPKPLASNTPKPIFEPIIITIPKTETPKEAPRDRKASAATLETADVDGRPRLINGQPVQVDEPPPCQINVNQERLSLINNGGTLSILIGVEKGYLLEDVKFVVSDPNDISIDLESETTGIKGRSLYVVKSISERTGTFRVTFYLPCGKRDVTVIVR